MKRFGLFILCLFILTGCGNKSEYPELSDYTVNLEIPVSDSEVMSIPIPGNIATTQETDNHLYTKYLNDVKIYKISDTSEVGFKTTQYPGVLKSKTSVMYVSDDYCILVQCPSEYTSTFAKLLAKRELVEKNICLYTDNMLTEFPKHETMEDMIMLENNMYMPTESVAGVLDTGVAVNFQGTSFIESYVQDGTYDQLIDEWSLLVLTNSVSTNVNWCTSEDIIYLESDEYCLVAKKLLYNQWYVYYGTKDWYDYMMTGALKVRSSFE